MRFSALLILALFTSVRAEDKPVELGDPAPQLDIAHWVKGGEVKGFEKGKVYVVEFWATWCRPCVANIPHLTQMQEKFRDKGVVFISVSDEPLGTVKPFVEKRWDAMGYTVAVDRDRATNAAYMEPFGVGGIPHAFVVNGEGKLVWHGHPQDRLEQTLEEVLAGTYDLEKARKLDAARAAREKAAQAAAPALRKYFDLISSKGADTAQVKASGREVLKALRAINSPDLYNEVSWEVLTNDKVIHRDAELAVALAELGVEASKGESAAILDTYARALHDTGKLAEAVEQQKKAVKQAEDTGLKAELTRTLKQYEAELRE